MFKIVEDFFPRKSFLRNFSVLISTNIIVSAIGMFTSVYVARVLSPVNYGKYGVILSVVSILSVFSSLGLPTTITREVSRNQDNSNFYFWSSAIGYFLGFLLSTALVFLLCYFKIINIESHFHGLILLSLFFSSVWNMLQNVAFGMQRMEHVSMVNLIMTIALLVIYIVTPKNYVTLEYVLSLTIVIQLFKDAILYWSFNKSNLFKSNTKVSFKSKVNFSIILIKVSFPFLILGFFSMLSNQMPIQFLNINSGSEEVAFFNAANKLLLPVSLIITTAMTAVFPNLTKLYTKDRLNYINKIRSGFKLLIYFGVLGAVIITLFKYEIVELVYGKLYFNTALVLTYQVWFMVTFSIFNFIGTILSSSDNQKLLTYLSIVYAIISVTILWLGSFYGAEYISLSFLIASFINLTYHWYFMEKALSWPFNKAERIKLLAVLVVPGLILVFIPNSISLIFRVVFCLLLLITLFSCNKKIKLILKINSN
jgi:O-antigen/teichoic acid export membrane protein